MKKFLAIIGGLSLSLFLALCTSSVRAECVATADPAVMDKAYLAHLNGLSADESDRIAVLPLRDLHGYQPEPILPYGAPYLIYDMYSGTNDNLIHPRYTQAVLRELNLSEEQWNDPRQAKTVADKLGARYVVFGSVQRSSPTEARFVIGILDAKKNEILSPSQEFATELNDSFFSLLRSHLEKGFVQMKARLKPAAYKDPSLTAFRYYVRGLQLSENYHRTNLELASLWFEKALKETYHNYDDAALNLARSRLMMALLDKLAHSDFTQNVLIAKAALNFVKNRSEAPKYDLTYRFLQANAAFVNGLTAMKTGNTGVAQKEASKAFLLTPEDGMAEALFWQSGAGAKGKVQKIQPVCL